jgi:hypothetical protein
MATETRDDVETGVTKRFKTYIKFSGAHRMPRCTSTGTTGMSFLHTGC